VAWALHLAAVSYATSDAHPQMSRFDSPRSPERFTSSFRAILERPVAVPVNITFVLGAGFSNSWDARYPVGTDLFDFSNDDWRNLSPALADFLDTINFYTDDSRIDRAAFLDIVYQVGMLRKYPPIRHRYVDDYRLALIERELRLLVYRKFAACAPLPRLSAHGLSFDDAMTEEQAAIQSFFGALARHAVLADPTKRANARVRVNFLTTNYDFVIEALVDSATRGKGSARASIASRALYRGFTPMMYCGHADVEDIMRPRASGHLLKLNGGFEIFRAGDEFEIDYRVRADVALQANPPEVILPSRAQDYDLPYFQGLFPKAVRLLQESRIVVLVGYGFPDEDALLRLLLRQFAEAPADGRQRELYYIDLEDERTQQARVKTVFPHANGTSGLAVVPFQGTFGQWCKAVLAGGG
jgi:hypothetical protein